MNDIGDPRFVETLKKASTKIRELLVENEGLRRKAPIAVIGMGCRFPGQADSIDRFWDLLANSVDAVGEIPAARWDVAAYYDADPDAPGRMYTRNGAFIGDVAGFDSAFFGITPREAEAMDPQQRLLLEVSWEALEDATLDASGLAGSRTGVFIGLSNYDYIQAHIHSGDVDRITAYSGSGVMFSTAAGRLAYFYDFRGPCITTDTACSSSLVSLHLAMQSLRNGECDLAVAGGVSLLLSLDSYIALCKVKALSVDGRCRTFDAAANGYGRGEGCGLLVLKRLADAERDGDRVLAVLAGSAVNHDGRSNGLTAPNGVAQQAVIRAALQDAGVAPEAVDYVEAHGTGTSLGDPIEVNALQQVFGARTSGQPLLLGSVKTNIGHTEAAAGVAGVIKVVLALQNRKIPANLHFTSPNAHIDWARGSVRVADALTDWSKPGSARVAGVSSFGLSGTNAHIVVTEASETPIADEPTVDRPVHILPLSASSPEGLWALCQRYDAFLAREPEVTLADVCHSAARRSHLRQRLAITGETITQMRAGLNAIHRGDNAPRERQRTESKGLVWLFSGQGSQYVGMGRELYRTQPVFHDVLDRCNDLAGGMLGRPLVDHLYADDASEGALRQTGVAQPALFALQYALAELWRSWGVHPAAVAGHSIGEYAAACVAGVFSLETGLRLALERGRQMQSLPSGGGMAAVFASEETVRASLAQWEGRVALAAVNERSSVTLSGDEEAVTAVLARLAENGVEGRRLAVSHAFHSPLMAPMVKGFEAVLAKCDFAAPRVPFYSTVTGDALPARGRMTADYWSCQIVQPVHFLNAVRALARDGYATFLEIGPSDTLAALTRQALGPDECVALSSLRKGEPAWKRISASIAELYASGIDISWAGFDAPYPRRKLSVPTYPFQRQHHWLEVGPLRVGSGSVAAAKQVPPPAEEAATKMTAGVTAKVDQKNQRTQVADEIASMLAEVSGFAASEVDRGQHLMDMGLDSIMLLKLGQGLERRYGVELRLSMLFEDLSTIDKLAAYLLQHGTIPAPDGETANPTAPQNEAAPRSASPAVIAPPAAGQALDGEPASLFQQQLHYLSQVAAQNLQSMTDLARQQMAWLEQTADPAAASVPAKAPAPALPRLPLPPAPIKVPTRTAAPRASAPRASAHAANFRAINLAASGPLTTQQRAFVDDLARRHIERTPTSKALTQQSRAVLADWKHTLSFWGQLKETKYPIVSARSEGARFWDLDGNEYVDVAMGMGVHFFGHKAPFIHAALERQLRQGIELGTQTALTGKAAQLIHELTGVDRVAFSNTGSEVVMVALRLARAVTGRDKIVIFKNSYHGIFDGVLAIEEDGEIVPIGLGTPAGMIKDVMVLEYGADESLDVIAANGDQLAAVLVEPVQSRNPDLQPQGFLKKLRRLTETHGVALIFDEMINGFRIDPGGAQAWFGVQADIVTYGKIVGGGLPIGVVAGKAKFLDYIDGGTWDYGDRSGPQSAMIYFGGTFCRNPMTMAAAHAALMHLKERGPALQEEVTARTSAFCDALNYWFERERVPLRAKHFSSQWRLVPLGDKELQPIEIELLYLLMMDHGVYTWERRISFFSEAHSDADVAQVLDVIKGGIRQIRAGGFAFEVADYPAPQFSNLSSPQRRLYSLSQRPGGQLAYHLPQSFWVDGPLDLDRLEDCFRTIIRRHESLRSSFTLIDGDLVSSVVEEPRFSIERMTCEESRIDEAAREFLRPFDLARAPLLRVAAVKVADRRHLILADAHHVVVDGLSFNIIARELMALYEGRALPPVDYDLRSCLSTMAQAGDGEHAAAHETFWRDQLGGELPLLDLPMDCPRAAEPDFQGDQVLLTLDAQVTRRLKDLSRKAGASLYMVLLAAYNVLLYRLTLQEDILVGGAVSGRDKSQLASAVGMFVNTVVFRNRPNGRMPFRSLLDAVKRNCVDVYDHQDYPFELIARLSDSRPQGRNALFDTMLSYENAGVRAFRIKDLDFTLRDFQLPGAMFDLHLDVIEDSDVLNLKFGYATALFRHDTIVRWAGYFEKIIAGVLDDPDRPLGLIEILGPAEEAKLGAWNDTDVGYPRDKTLVDLFEEQVAKGPDRPAVICGSVTLTYRELNERANRAAHALRTTHHIEPGMAVGVYLDRSERVIVSILGILKTGATYVPLDVGYPEDLVDYMIGDSACRAILTTPDLAQKLPSAGRGIAADIATHDGGDAHDPVKVLSPDDVAYVIYTSGSTGKPKGCAVTHRNVVRLMKNDRHDFDFGSDDVWICAHSFCFDFSVWEMYGALLYGGRVVVARKHEVRDPRLLLGLVRVHHVTVLNQTPAAFYSLIQAELAQPEHTLAEHLRYVVFGGDRLEPTYLAGWVDLYPLDRIALVNMYGITETTVHVTYFRLRPEDVGGPPGRSLIGRPLPETRVYVCNEHLQRQPLGVVGELYVGGSGVCNGYLNKPELTAERFLESGFRAGERLYRTGDLGRLRPDGTLEYLGRNDAQVQIRGHRVETGAVTQQLLGHPNVQKALVVDREGADGNRELVAYVIGSAGLNASALRQHLALTLPDYMIPSHFVQLDELPLTANGKIDRAALPSLGARRLDVGTDYMAPRDAVEETIAGTWREVLNLPRVGINDNYFALGGDSIKALQIVNRLHRAGMRISLGQIFAGKTVAGLARMRKAAAPAISSRAQRAGLSAIQHWFLAEHTCDINHFNNAVLLRAASKIDHRALEQAIDALQSRHEALRLQLRMEQGVPRQEVGPAAPVAIEFVDIRGEQDPAGALARHAAQIQRSFNLQDGPLMCCALYRMSDGDRLLVACHHWVVDGLSWRILLEDLTEAYQQAVRGAPIELPAPTDGYLRWAAVQQTYAESPALLEEAAFWADMEALPVPPLPRDFDDPRNTHADARTLTFEMGEAETKALLTEIHRAHGTEINDILLTAVALAFRARFGLDRIRVQVEGHGREDIAADADFHRTIGWFTSIYPVVLDLGNARDAAAQILRVKQQLRRIPRKGVGYAILKYLTPAPLRANLAFGPAPDIGFNYLGQFDTAVDGFFSLASEQTGATQGDGLQRHQAIEIEGMTIGRRLTFSIIYNHRLHRRDTIQGLADHLRDSLLALIDACAGGTSVAQRHGLAPADFNFVVDRLGVAPADVDDVLPLSPMQEGMLFHALSGDRQSYFEQFTYRLRGALDVPLFVAAWGELAHCHQALRAAFVHTSAQHPLQVILKHRTIEVLNQDLRAMAPSERTAFVERFRLKDRERWFDLARDALMRVAVLETGDEEYEVVWSCHHIIIDGWSAAILQQDLLTAYEALRAGQKPALQAAPPFSLYLDWLTRRDRDASRSYWRGYLADCPPATAIPGLDPRRARGYAPAEHDFVLDPGTSAALSQLAARLEVTLNTLVQTLWGVQLGRYHDAQDVVFGSVVSGRPPDIAGIERMAGLFLQSIPVRIRMEKEQSFSALAREVQRAAIASEPHHHLPLVEMQMLSGVRQTLFDHVLVFENYPLAPGDGASGLRADNLRVFEQMHYDFSVVVHPGEAIEVKFMFNRNVAAPEQMARMEAHFRTLVAGVLRDADVTLENLDILPNDERRTLARQLSTPDAVAAQSAGEALAYDELSGIWRAGSATGPSMRVELADIARAAMSHPEIDHAVAAAYRRADGSHALVCYYTEKNPLDQADLRRRLGEDLPQHMIPALFVRLDAFPLDSNGKVDDRALPKPEELIADRIHFEPPANETERKVAAIWSEILGLRSVGVNSPFFAIGGDSLRMIRVIGRINRDFGSNVTVGLFVERPTVRQIAQYLRGGDDAGGGLIPALPAAADYPVSHAQRRLWILDQLGVNTLAYSLPAAYLLEGRLNIDALQRAFVALVDRHESLRTTFVAVNGEPRQRVHRDIEFRVDVIDLRNEADPNAAATALARANAEQSFDLIEGPLFRASLLVLGPDHHVMLVNVHHIVSDARSISVMVEEILARYASDARGLPPLRIHYKDFASWENARVASAEAGPHRAYWLSQLAAPLEPLELPLDRPRPAMPRFHGDRVSMTLAPEAVRALKQFSEASHGTLFMALVALVKALLYRHTGQQDIIVGSPIASRDHEELQRQVGFYVNTLALRDRVSGDEGFASLFLKVRGTILAALEHRLYPFDRLVEELAIPRDLSRLPVFEVMVVLQEAAQRALALHGVRVSEFFTDWKISKFSLTFEFVETASGEIALNLDYDTDLFDRGRIERLAAQLSVLLVHALADPACPLRALDILPASERRVLSSNNPVAEIPRGKTVVSLFEEVAAEFPANPAVVAGDVELSYADLNGRANAVARCLAERGVGRGDLVAVLLDRSESWVIALFGILKAGAVYLPLDPTYPRERLEYMLMDSGCATVITEPQHRDIVGDGARTVLDIHALATGTAANPVSAITETDLAYVIYTSGSTGQPKGVLLEHGGAVNLAFALTLGLGILPTHRILQFAPSSFDASISEILMTLTQGACLIIAAPDDIRDTQAFARLLREKRVSMATLPPSYVAQLAADDLAPLELLLTAGEAPRVDQALMLSRRLRYVNAYGPTESTVCATWHCVDPTQAYDGTIPIGRAIANIEVVVLDRHGNLMPIGVTGEICIGGRGLARGYHGRPDLTAQSFVAHPFRPGARLYRTGDLGYVRPDGEIVYVGRNDRQVKLRGHRIELGEIERCLLRHPSVGKAVIDVRPTADGTADLAAYVVASSPVSAAALHDHLARQLPAYMIPAAWVQLDAIPLTANGKVNHAALPPVEGREVAVEPKRPASEIEVRVAEVWRGVLNRDGFGVDDRFFEVGGDSIKAIQIVNRLRRAGFKLDVRDLLQFPTIGGLAGRLGGNQVPPADALEQVADLSLTSSVPGIASSGLTRIPLSVQELEDLFDRD